MKIAEFKNIALDYKFISTGAHENIHGYIRLSEYIEVDFIPRDNATTTLAEIAVIDDQIDKIRMEFGGQIDKLMTRKSELLALTNHE